ncbi:MAG: NAD(P)H-dependent oxidoreductase [Acidobacteria bacterium]|nr:NAD(P)H-dependent oxidoreductase [Acidobacteriota bacterium]
MLVTFYSRTGSTEKLALAAAVGAVQGRALIRLRRLPDLDAPRTLEEFPDHRETLQRMHREYVAPAEADILRADALILAAPPGFSASSAEWAGYLDMLGRLASSGALTGKVAAVVETGDESTLRSFSARLSEIGLAVVPSASLDARALGYKVAAAAGKDQKASPID